MYISFISSTAAIIFTPGCVTFQQQSKPGKLDFNDLTACIIWHSKFHSDDGWELIYWLIFSHWNYPCDSFVPRWLVHSLSPCLYHNVKWSYGWCGNYNRQQETCSSEENNCACSFVPRTILKMKEAYWGIKSYSDSVITLTF